MCVGVGLEPSILRHQVGLWKAVLFLGLMILLLWQERGHLTIERLWVLPNLPQQLEGYLDIGSLLRFELLGPRILTFQLSGLLSRIPENRLVTVEWNWSTSASGRWLSCPRRRRYRGSGSGGASPGL